MNKKKIIVSIITILIILGIIFGLCIPNYVIHKARQAGANDEQVSAFLKEKNIKKWHETLTHTPSKNDNILNEEIDIDPDIPVLLLIYRFQCPDCENAFDTMQEEISKLSKEQKINVYWVPSRTEIGAKVVAQYPIKAVPSSVLLYKGDSEVTLLYDLETGDIYTEEIKNVFQKYKDCYKK